MRWKQPGRVYPQVKAKQEHELKLKAFAPPYAREPELYLLPGGSNEGSSYGSAATPDQRHTEYSGSDLSDTRVTDPTWDKTINSSINDNKTVTTQPHQGGRGGRSYIWNRKLPEIIPISQQYLVQTETGHVLPLLNGKGSNAQRASEAAPSEDAEKLTGRNPTGDSGISDSLVGAETERSRRKRPEKPLEANPANSQPRNQQHQFGGTTFRHPVEPAHYQPPPSPPLLPDFPTIQSPKPQMTARNETIQEQLKRVREERVQLEKSREEMIKRIKSLLEQYKLRRHQARDSWKKKYFESKKATSALEETLNKLKSEQDIYYQKLLTQLAARDSRQRAKNPTLAASSKNSLIMTITSKQQELDQLKRKVENVRIKLLIEIKMRKQASSDLHVLKAELAHKKSTSVIAGPLLHAA
ncbi:spermatogenesis-associated protein 1 isoform X2 [Pseudophryne corroboree]|uniref:spermatogenesis-associated protein 1 isoform X2 n=1 Tax=Pseudophryne corroboree TaxID=495146 RepID=UPI0030814442